MKAVTAAEVTVKHIKKPIVLTDFDRLNIKLGRITQIRMLVDSRRHPKSGLDHPTLRIDSIFKIDNSLIIKIKGIRLERIQLITKEDALASGYPKRILTSNTNTLQLKLNTNEITYFDEAWNEKYGDGAYQANDWVWVFDIAEWGGIH